MPCITPLQVIVPLNTDDMNSEAEAFIKYILLLKNSTIATHKSRLLDLATFASHVFSLESNICFAIFFISQI